MGLEKLIQSGDWKNEKHVPAIIAESNVNAGDIIEIKVHVGEDIKHPNTFEHNIQWIKVLFQGEDDKFPVEIASFDFKAHGELGNFTDPYGVARLTATKSGTIYALSYCNIHGLWENKLDITVK